MTVKTTDDLLSKAPVYEKLPEARPRARRGGPELFKLQVKLKVITPIFGGSYQTRAIDVVDLIRAPSVRGNLRFWWRALYSSRYDNAEELYKRESELWGSAATDSGGRSAVEIRISNCKDLHTDESAIGPWTPGAYALWPARQTTDPFRPTAHRRKPGTIFELTLRIFATEVTQRVEITNALLAWILFGGYGGRTRRGLGSLTVVDNASEWLPNAATHKALSKLFGFDILEPSEVPAGDVPWLRGASIYVGHASNNAQNAWTTALDWLQEFRQGPLDPAGDRAREPGTGKVDPSRPSISNWPEADKVRHFLPPSNGNPCSHTPRHNAIAAWPRAGFGLPINGQFQKSGREQGERYTEPAAFELRWQANDDVHDRLASPLIVKALPLADGKFAPCALWLNRAHPTGGEVVLQNAPNSKASFDCLVAAGDTARFSALAGKANLRQAFLDWLQSRGKATVLAP